jgi:hypothetical protein
MDTVKTTYFCTKKVCLNRRVAKWINLPANPWNLTKLILDELVPERSLIDHVDVVHSGLIMHAHAPIASTAEAMPFNTEQKQLENDSLGTSRSIHQFQPSRADEPLYSIFDHVVLVPPPSLEECLQSYINHWSVIRRKVRNKPSNQTTKDIPHCAVAERHKAFGCRVDNRASILGIGRKEQRVL